MKNQLSTSVLNIGYFEKLRCLLEKHLTFELYFVNPRFAPKTKLYYRYCRNFWSLQRIFLINRVWLFWNFLFWEITFVKISRYYKDVYVNSFVPNKSRPWNSLPIEFFPLTYDLSGFKSRINRYLLTVGSL